MTQDILNKKMPNGDTFSESLAVTYMEMLKSEGLEEDLKKCVKYYIKCTKWERHLYDYEAREIIEFASKKLEEKKNGENISINQKE